MPKKKGGACFKELGPFFSVNTDFIVDNISSRSVALSHNKL